MTIGDVLNQIRRNKVPINTWTPVAGVLVMLSANGLLAGPVGILGVIACARLGLGEFVDRVLKVKGDRHRHLRRWRWPGESRAA